MTDTNRPVAFDILDTEAGVVIGRYSTHQEALDACIKLEPKFPGPPGTWRFMIEPIRMFHLPPPQERNTP